MSASTLSDIKKTLDLQLKIASDIETLADLDLHAARALVGKFADLLIPAQNGAAHAHASSQTSTTAGSPTYFERFSDLLAEENNRGMTKIEIARHLQISDRAAHRFLYDGSNIPKIHRTKNREGVSLFALTPDALAEARAKAGRKSR